ncbi:Putative serine protease HhoB precursor [Aquisphaera giovannonii]|uniref:Serine protease HhoB n=1 Tax=Aquisphaera giovannonii TaxID=406548 RepID=A0A5B9VXD0_9BACT|nr:Putative serine protease HhoB precursor [Aquisphaera giovannonii]
MGTNTVPMPLSRCGVRVPGWIAWGLGVAALAGCLAPGVGAAGPGAGSTNRRTVIVEAVEKALPCMVNISSEKKAASTSRWPFSAEENQRPRISGMGSGVIVDPRGYILTNHHVVDKVQGVEVQLSDGTTYPGRVLQYDPVMDLALVKVEPARPLRAIAVGTSADLMVGETVITIGNAFGYENTVSVGIVSALHRDVTLSDEQVYRNLIQTDASINPGNSGGPLVNVDGELIGINVATRAGAQGIGFALPIDEVKRVAAEMLSTRRIASTWHGLVAEDLVRGAQRSVVLASVQPGSPGETAGFKPGDELVRVGDLAVANMIDLERGLLDARPGHPTRLTVRRGGVEQPLPLDVQPLPRGMTVAAAEPTDQVWERLGVKTMPVSPEWVATVSRKLRGGLYIEAVLPGSPAAAAAVQKGDILVGMNVGTRNWETIRPDNILYVLRQPEAIQSGGAVLLLIRKNELQPCKITLAEPRARKVSSR